MVDIPYTLIRSKRRTLSLTVSKNGDLIVRSPLKVHTEMIERFIHDKSDWIKKHQATAQERQKNTIIKNYTPSERDEMKENLKKYITCRISELKEGKNLPQIQSIKITKSESRWGSCSSKNGLCFSYRLAEYLDMHHVFIDAIIIHELAHLREKNHQKPFWNLVYNWMPHYEEVIKKYRSGPIF